MAREITWSWHTEVGHWNTSFNATRIGDYLNFLGNYKDIYFKRNDNGRIKFILAKSPNSGWAAWTSGFICRINVDYNFNISAMKDVLCAYVTCHEFGHMVLPGGVGGDVHSKTLGLMHPNCNMPAGNLYEADYPWFNAYPWKPGLKYKPHQEPGRMKAAFAPKLAAGLELETMVLPMFGCNHEPVKRPWYDIRPQSWLVP
jgi:hypothetical protein